MSFDIPTATEFESALYASAAHISTDEATLNLIRPGLDARRIKGSPQNAILAGLGLFSDPEEAAALDDAVAIAYEERRRPSKSV